MLKDNNGLNKIHVILIILMISFFALIGKFIFSSYNTDNILSIVNNMTFSSQELLRNSIIISNSPNNSDMRNIIKNKDDLEAIIINLKLGKIIDNGEETKLFLSDLDFARLNNLLTTSSNIVNNASFVIDKKDNLIKYTESVENYNLFLKDVLANIQIFANSSSLTNQEFKAFLVEMYGNINNDSIIKLSNNNFQEVDFLNKKINTFNNLKLIYQSLLKYNKEDYFNETSYSLYRKLLLSTNKLLQNGQQIINNLPDIITINDFSNNTNSLYDNLNNNYKRITKLYNDDLQNQIIYFYFSLFLGVVFIIVFIFNLLDKTPQNSQIEKNYKRYKRGVEEISSILTNLSTDNTLFQQFRSNNRILRARTPIAKDLLNQLIIIFNKFYYENIALNRAAKEALASIESIKQNQKNNIKEYNSFTKSQRIELIKNYNKTFDSLKELLLSYKGLEEKISNYKDNISASKENVSYSIKKMDTLRMLIQEIIKILKKLGEISQSMNANIENINSSNEKILISSLNIAISASDDDTVNNKKHLESAQDTEKVSEQIKELIDALSTNRDDITNYSKDAIQNMENGTTSIIEAAEYIEHHKKELNSIIELTNSTKISLLENNKIYNTITTNFNNLTNEMFLLIDSMDVGNDDHTLLIDKLDSIELQVKEIISKTSDKEL